MTSGRTFPVLYKQTLTGKIQRWKVWADQDKVITEYGLTDGKKQVTTDVIKSGKNLGRSNATTTQTQAQAQAAQSWEAKLKEGYVDNIQRATENKNNLQAIEPMLAHAIEKKEKYVTFPGAAQPKLDGLRCIAIIKDGKARLFSRSQKEYLTVPHIVAELEQLYKGKDIILDGELYNHLYKDSFNTIIHVVKRDEVHAQHTMIEYHIYDVVAAGNYSQRNAAVVPGKYCKKVSTVLVMSRKNLDAYQAQCVEQGYEGCMYRNLAGQYEHKRSNFLLKVKNFQDDEFTITGVEEGTGKLMNAVGAFALHTQRGVAFKAKPACTLEQSREYWKNRAQYPGKRATIKFQNYTPDGVPRFPVFKCIRD